MGDDMLPPQFSELEVFAADWALPTEDERYTKRLKSTMQEMEAFYDAILPRVKEAVAFLNQFDLNEMPNQARKLMRLLYSAIAVSWAVEVWKTPVVPDSQAAYFQTFKEPSI